MRIAAPAPASAPALAQDNFIRYLENCLFYLTYKIEIVTIYKNFFSDHNFFQ